MNYTLNPEEMQLRIPNKDKAFTLYIPNSSASFHPCSAPLQKGTLLFVHVSQRIRPDFPRKGLSIGRFLSYNKGREIFRKGRIPGGKEKKGTADDQRGGLRGDHCRERRIYAGPGRRGGRAYDRSAGGLPADYPGVRRPDRRFEPVRRLPQKRGPGPASPRAGGRAGSGGGAVAGGKGGAAEKRPGRPEGRPAGGKSRPPRGGKHRAGRGGSAAERCRRPRPGFGRRKHRSAGGCPAPARGQPGAGGPAGPGKHQPQGAPAPGSGIYQAEPGGSSIGGRASR